jgi:hypothetical protein
MDLTFSEATAIKKVRRMVTLLQRNILTEAEVVREVVMELILAGDGAERVIPNCAAVLSPELRDRLLDYVGELASSDYRGWYFVIGEGLSEDQLERLRPRCRTICDGIVAVFREAEERPMPLDDAAAINVDVFWTRLRDQTTTGNPPCRSPQCEFTSLNTSIYCARHHYEQTVGGPPPGV